MDNHLLVPKITLGSTELTISRLGLGTVKLGRTQGVKYPQAFTLPNDTEATELLVTAHELGINLIDTAPAYGESETRLGQLIYGVASRPHWVLMSKVGEEFDNGESRFDFSPSHIKFSIERSLSRLKTDYLDIVLVHSDGRDQALIEEEGVFDTLNRLKEQGYFRYFGMSTKTVSGGLLTVQQADVVMVTHHLEYQEEKTVIEAALAHHKGVFIKKALGSGHLPDPKAALRFALAEPGVSSVIVGTRNPAHLKENAQLD